MKQLYRYTMIFLALLANTYAEDTNISTITIQCKQMDTIPIKKTHESTYDKFERIFSEYEGTWIEDMFIYSADIMIPDEMTQAVKDVVKNREEQGFEDQAEKLPKTLANDAYSMVLTTAYYYMQDVSRITERIWKKEACNPDPFTYDMSKEPKEPVLNLKESDPEARGVTGNGVVLPINDNFPDALYPYAAKPDGCSAEGLQDLYDQSNDISDDGKWLKEACDAHDRCYFTEGTTAKECNSQFIVEAIDACNHISAKDTVLFMGMKNAFCGIKGFGIATGANACARRYFSQAQKKQKAYNQWVMRYEKAYSELICLPNSKEKGQ